MADWRTSRLAGQSWPKVAVGVAVLAALVLLVVASGVLSDDDINAASAGSGADRSTQVTDADGAPIGDAAGDDDRGDGDGDGDATARTAEDGQILPPEAVPAAALPIHDDFTAAGRLADGDVVHLHVAAADGSQLYALEARLCAGGTTFATDSDIRPSRTGKCVDRPLSAASDDTIEVRAEPPYQSLDLDFRVGVGSISYTTQSGRSVTITCDRDHPCLLAVKYQVPEGFGYRTYPLEFR